MRYDHLNMFCDVGKTEKVIAKDKKSNPGKCKECDLHKPKNSKGMICNLLLIYASDSERIKDDLIQQLRGVPAHCVCIDDPRRPCQQSLNTPTKAKVQVVFFSPGFLKFLECKPEEAYASFMHLDPQSTVALFCCGMRETEVMCYHMAPLKSYSSWPKFEVIGEQDETSVFSPYFMGMFQEVFPPQNSTPENVVIVPDLINKESNTVYVIFSNTVPNMGGISVHLESERRFQIAPENMNPHVLEFKVPVMLLENCQSFKVKIQLSKTVLARKVLRIAREPIASKKYSRKKDTVEKSHQIKELDMDLKMLEDIGSIGMNLSDSSSEASECTISPQEDDITFSLLGMCKKYGLEELSPFINEISPPKKEQQDSRSNSIEGMNTESVENGVPENRCNAAEKNSFNVVADVHHVDTRPSSLSLSPGGQCFDTYDHYLPMGFSQRKPILLALDSKDASCDESFQSNYTYVNMKLGMDAIDSLDAAKKGLSKSQQELVEMIHDFKKGIKTISDVEEQFRIWQQNHKEISQNNEQEEDRSSFLGVWRKPKRKLSRISDASTDRTSTLSSSENKRKSSNDSASSASSKISENRNSTVSSDCNSGSNKNLEVSTGWIPQYSTVRMCPPIPRPLPTPPTPEHTQRTYENGMSRATSVKRKAGTYLPPTEGKLETANVPKCSDYQEDDERVESLIQVCEKFGLQHLGDYFISEFCEDNDASPENFGISKEDISTAIEEKDTVDRNYPNEWSQEKNLSFLRRTLSLPTFLNTEEIFPTVPMQITDDDLKGIYDDVQYEGGSEESLTCKCGDGINTYISDIYMSVKSGDICNQPETEIGFGPQKFTSDGNLNTLLSDIYMSVMSINPNENNENKENQTLDKYILSNSQVELLELMEDFKRGQRTISQVEHQFQEWHDRHVGTSSDRDKQLLQLKNEYGKAQKGTSGLKKFILRKPRKKDHKNSTDESGTKGKQKLRKTDSDNRRLSKISYTSTSSGVSDNSDVSRNCYFNPSYGETKNILDRSISSSFKSNSPSPGLQQPPPLPPRPPLTPAASLRSLAFDNSDASEAEKTPARSRSGSPMPLKKKPSPPPKPPNLLKSFEKLDYSTKGYEPENEKSKGDLVTEDTEARPGSPDYITPEHLPGSLPRKKLIPQKAFVPNPDCPLHCHVHLADKERGMSVPGSAPFTMNRLPGGPKKKDSFADHLKGAIQKRQLFGLANQWMKSKKKEESMFYVTRKWSSFPELEISELPVYLDLQELWEGRTRSTSDSTNPVE